MTREYRATRTTPIEGSEFEATHQGSPRENVDHFVVGNVMAQRGQYSQGTQVAMSFGPSTQVARLAMRALPPVKKLQN